MIQQMAETHAYRGFRRLPYEKNPNERGLPRVWRPDGTKLLPEASRRWR